MKHIKIFSVVTLLCICSHTVAQLPSGVEDDGEVRFNYIKLNLTAIQFNNYSLQYERVMNKKSAIALSVRFMPESRI